MHPALRMSVGPTLFRCKNMPRKKKARGRPPIHPLPPRADATPEELAKTLKATNSGKNI